MATMWNSRTEEQAVKRLLRRKDTAEYFKGDGWTGNPGEAKTFSDSLEAAETCARLQLSNVELALRVESGDFDMFCTPMC